MNIDQILKPIDNLFLSINENKTVLLLILILLGIYAVEFNQYISENAVDLFSNNIFKLVIFVIITYIGSSSPAIGISLAIIVLVSLQVITNLKFKKQIENEKFSQIEAVDMSNLNNEYLISPLEMQKDLSPPTNFDLKLTDPNELYIQMLRKGKNLLDDSYEIDKDLEKRYDIREKQISDVAKRNGTELVDSGINRLQKSDQGEYNLNNNQKFNKFIKYNKLIESNKNNPSIMAAYNELINNYEMLISKQLDDKSFNIQLDKVYLNELELIETIYKNKKNNLSDDKQKNIDLEIFRIKQLKTENKKWIDRIPILLNIIQ